MGTGAGTSKNATEQEAFRYKSSEEAVPQPSAGSSEGALQQLTLGTETSSRGTARQPEADAGNRIPVPPHRMTAEGEAEAIKVVDTHKELLEADKQDLAEYESAQQTIIRVLTMSVKNLSPLNLRESMELENILPFP